MVLNYTPHTINLRIGDVETSYISNGIARVNQVTVPTGIVIDGAEVFTSTFGDVTGLPEQVEGTYIIVSAMVLSALNGSRNDVIAPKTDSTAIRNEAGHIVAVTGWLM